MTWCILEGDVRDRLREVDVFILSQSPPEFSLATAAERSAGQEVWRSQRAEALAALDSIEAAFQELLSLERQYVEQIATDRRLLDEKDAEIAMQGGDAA